MENYLDKLLGERYGLGRKAEVEAAPIPAPVASPIPAPVASPADMGVSPLSRTRQPATNKLEPAQPSFDQLLDTHFKAIPPPRPSFGRQALEAVKSSAAEVLGSRASMVSPELPFAFGGMETPQELKRLPRAEYAKQITGDMAKVLDVKPLPPSEGWLEPIVRGAGAMVPQLAELVYTGTTLGGAAGLVSKVPGIAGALAKSPRAASYIMPALKDAFTFGLVEGTRPEDAARGAIEGGITGAAFGALHPMGKLAKVVGGGGIGALGHYLADPNATKEDIAASGILMGVFGMLGERGGRDRVRQELVDSGMDGRKAVNAVEYMEWLRQKAFSGVGAEAALSPKLQDLHKEWQWLENAKGEVAGDEFGKLRQLQAAVEQEIFMETMQDVAAGRPEWRGKIGKEGERLPPISEPTPIPPETPDVPPAEAVTPPTKPISHIAPAAEDVVPPAEAVTPPTKPISHIAPAAEAVTPPTKPISPIVPPAEATPPTAPPESFRTKVMDYDEHGRPILQEDRDKLQKIEILDGMAKRGKKGVPGLTDREIEFVKGRVERAGSLDAARKLYSDKSAIDDYGRRYAEIFYGKGEGYGEKVEGEKEAQTIAQETGKAAGDIGYWEEGEKIAEVTPAASPGPAIIPEDRIKRTPAITPEERVERTPITPPEERVERTPITPPEERVERTPAITPEERVEHPPEPTKPITPSEERVERIPAITPEERVEHPPEPTKPIISPEEPAIPSRPESPTAEKVTPPVITQTEYGPVVSTPIPPDRAAALTLRQQKEALIDEINTAIRALGKAAKGPGIEATLGLSHTREIKNAIILEVPGDGKFTVPNDRDALARFRKHVERNFPVREEAPAKPKSESVRPLAKRIEDEDIAYYKDYAPKPSSEKSILDSIEKKLKDYEKRAYRKPKKNERVYGERVISPPYVGMSEDGYIVDTGMAVWPKREVELPKNAIRALPSVTAMEGSDLSPVVSMAEFSNMGRAGAYLHVVAENGRESSYNPVYVDRILSQHPDSKAFLSETNDGTRVLSFKNSDGKTVGLVMPFYDEIMPDPKLMAGMTTEGVTWQPPAPVREEGLQAGKGKEELYGEGPIKWKKSEREGWFQEAYPLERSRWEYQPESPGAKAAKDRNPKARVFRHINGKIAAIVKGKPVTFFKDVENAFQWAERQVQKAAEPGREYGEREGMIEEPPGVEAPQQTPKSFSDEIRDAVVSKPSGPLSKYEERIASGPDPHYHVLVDRGECIAVENDLYNETLAPTGKFGGTVVQVGPGRVGRSIFEISRPYGKLVYDEAAGSLWAERGELTHNMAVSKPGKSEFGKEEFKFGTDKEMLLPTIIKDVVNNDLTGTIANETVQNSLDGYLPGQLSKNFDVKIDVVTGRHPSSGEEMEFTIVEVSDNGSGMSREEVLRHLMKLGAKGKPGTTSRGGYGLAKAAFILAPVRTRVETVKDGKLTIAEGTQEQFFGVKKAGNPLIDTQPTDLPNGTKYTMTFIREPDVAERYNTFNLEAWRAKNAFERYFTQGIKTPGIQCSIGMYGGPTETYATSGLGDMPEVFPPLKVKSKGNAVTVYFVPDEYPRKFKNYDGKYDIRWEVYNKGLALFNLSRGLGLKGSRVPVDWKVLVNFDKTASVKDVTYPFIQNRTELNAAVAKDIAEAINAKIDQFGEERWRGEKEAFTKMVENSPTVNGVRIMIPFTDEVEFNKAKKLIEDNKALVSEVAELFISFQHLITKIGGKKIDLVMTVDPNVHGFRSVPETTGHEFYAINPFAITGDFTLGAEFQKLLDAKFDRNTALASNLVHTMVHELAHDIAATRGDSHGERWAAELARLYTKMTHTQLSRLEAEGRKFYEQYGRNLEELQGHFSRMGAGGSQFRQDRVVMEPAGREHGRREGRIEEVPGVGEGRVGAGATAGVGSVEPKFSVETQRGGQPVIDWTLGRIQSAFKGQEISSLDTGEYLVRTASGREIRVNPRDRTIYNTRQMESQLGRPTLPGERVAGSWQKLDRGGVIGLTDAAGESTLHHEAFHAAMDLALDAADRKLVLDKYGGAEQAAEAYADWRMVRESDTLAGKVFRKLYDWALGVRDALFGRTAEGVMRDVESGKVWEKGPTWYSRMQDVVGKKLPGSAGVNTVRGMLKNWANKGEFSKEEYELSGVDEWLREKRGKIGKQEVEDFLRGKGQPLFSITSPASATTGAAKTAQDAVNSAIDFLTPGWSAVKSVIDGAKSLLLPSAKSPAHLKAAELLSGELGPMHHAVESAGRLLKPANDYFTRHPDEMNAFMSGMSSGRPASPQHQHFADTVRQLFSKALSALEKAGVPLETVRENYFPGMWTRDSRRAFNQAVEEAIDHGIGAKGSDLNTWTPEQKAWVKTRTDALLSERKGSDNDTGLQYLSRRPFEGAESFRKPKVFDDIQTALDFGLKPVSNHPIDLVKLKLAEIYRSAMANSAINKWKESGDIIAVGNNGLPMNPTTKRPIPNAKPPDPGEWRPINDKYGTIWYRDSHGQLVKAGQYLAREPVSRILNNYLSSSLYNNEFIGPLFRGYMKVANLLNQAQLGIGSAFHAGFSTSETIASGFALNIQDFFGMLAGKRSMEQFSRGLYNTLTAPVQNPRYGGRILDEYLNPGSTGDRGLQALVKAIEIAGGRSQLEANLQTNITETMMRDWFAGDKIKAAAKSPFAAIELMARPIMQYLVPRQKLAVFGHMVERLVQTKTGKDINDLAADPVALDRTLMELAPELRQKWNRTDARLGQVVYDRLFMHNGAKSLIHGLIRAAGWTGGTIAEVGGGFKDAAKSLADWAKTGRMPDEISDRTAYTLALLVGAAMANGIATYALTGDTPRDMDWWAFRTGSKDEYGRDERFMFPTYAKDIKAYYEHPTTTLMHKTHPILSLIMDIAHNKDYYGVEVRSPGDPLIKQAAEVGWFGIKQFTPFWIRGIEKEIERQGGEGLGDVFDLFSRSPGRVLGPQIGIMPAPAEFGKTRAERLMTEIGAEERASGAATKAEREHFDLKRKIRHDFMLGNLASANARMHGAIQQGLLSKREVHDLLKTVGETPASYAFKRLKADDAIRVWNVMTEDERRAASGEMLVKMKSVIKNSSVQKRNELLPKFQEALGLR